ncbi:MAG: cytochrome c biogenesis protein [Armatimonadetes bacterium]|nr:cytochrome c biogenesis protein [Armatimonadota bacterium]MDW8121334.1 cytochrome c biogenesis protein CcsA [Armatimonadota bacterium]
MKGQGKRPVGVLLWLVAASVPLVLGFVLAFFWVPPAEEFAQRYGNGEIAKIVFVHVPLAIVSFFGFVLAGILGGVYLMKRDPRYDDWSLALCESGFLFALLATLTGAYFSKLAWGAWWHFDPRQTTMLMVLITYAAYLIVRQSVEDPERQAVIGSAYAILGAIACVALYFVIPYLPAVQTESLHPSGIIARGGLDWHYRVVLLLCLLGAALVYAWISSLKARLSFLERRRWLFSLSLGD